MGQGNFIPAPPIFDGKSPGNEVDGGTRLSLGCLSLRASSPRGSLEKSRESSTRKETRVRLRRQHAFSRGSVTAVFDPPISGQRGFCPQKWFCRSYRKLCLWGFGPWISRSDKLLYPGVSKDLRSARRVAVPFIGSEISLCDFLSIIKKSVFFGVEWGMGRWKN